MRQTWQNLLLLVLLLVRSPAHSQGGDIYVAAHGSAAAAAAALDTATVGLGAAASAARNNAGDAAALDAAELAAADLAAAGTAVSPVGTAGSVPVPLLVAERPVLLPAAVLRAAGADDPVGAAVDCTAALEADLAKLAAAAADPCCACFAAAPA